MITPSGNTASHNCLNISMWHWDWKKYFDLSIVLILLFSTEESVIFTFLGILAFLIHVLNLNWQKMQVHRNNFRCSDEFLFCWVSVPLRPSGEWVTGHLRSHRGGRSPYSQTHSLLQHKHTKINTKTKPSKMYSNSWSLSCEPHSQLEHKHAELKILKYRLLFSDCY